MSIRECWIPGSPEPQEELGRAHGKPVACGEHGCVGPFVNQSFQLGLGTGTIFGDCAECGRRGLVRRSERGFEAIGRLVEAFIPPPQRP